MVASKDVSQGSPNSEKQAVLGWRELAVQRDSHERRQRRRILGFVSVLLLIVLVFASVRLAVVVSASNDQLQIHVGNQQPVILDLRQSLPINPDILGTNVFPKFGTSSQDNVYGSMEYSSPLIAGLSSAHIKLLRFPGGAWGEDHYLSLDQLSAFSALLQQTNSDGMIQVRLSGTIKGSFSELTDITTRTAIAARWVDFLNNPHSDQRIAQYAHAPIGVKLSRHRKQARGERWKVGRRAQQSSVPQLGG